MPRLWEQAIAFATARPGAVLAGLTLLSALFSFVTQNGVKPDGDGPYYLMMQEALLSHGWPALSAGDIAQVRGRADFPPVFPFDFVARGLDGALYCLHFFFYPLLTAPFAALLKAFGADPILSFFMVNALSACAAAAYIGRSAALSLIAKLVVIVSFGATSVNWYAAWPHPEVLTVSLLLVSAVALVERRWLICGLCAGAAALQNPSAALLLLPAGAAIMLEGLARAPQNWRALVIDLAKLAVGGVVALVAPLFSFFTTGQLNPIAAAGFLDPSRVGPAMFGHYLFDPNQGAALGLTFLFTAAIAALVVRVHRARAGEKLFKRHDWLLLAALLISVPVLSQTNFNSGQYFVLRYVSWTFAPLMIWAAIELDARPRIVGAAWAGGFAIYALAFSVFLVSRFEVAMETRRTGAQAACEWCLFKPWAAAILDAAPGLYNPLPGVFAERVNNDDLGRDDAPATPVAYTRADGLITKILVVEGESFEAVCPHGIAPGAQLSRARAYPPYAYLNGEARCASAADAESLGP